MAWRSFIAEIQAAQTDNTIRSKSLITREPFTVFKQKAFDYEGRIVPKYLFKGVIKKEKFDVKRNVFKEKSYMAVWARKSPIQQGSARKEEWRALLKRTGSVWGRVWSNKKSHPSKEYFGETPLAWTAALWKHAHIAQNLCQLKDHNGPKNQVAPLGGEQAPIAPPTATYLKTKSNGAHVSCCIIIRLSLRLSIARRNPPRPLYTLYFTTLFVWFCMQNSFSCLLVKGNSNARLAIQQPAKVTAQSMLHYTRPAHRKDWSAAQMETCPLKLSQMLMQNATQFWLQAGSKTKSYQTCNSHTGFCKFSIGWVE